MDPDKASVGKRFAHDLRQLHLRAGRPSYSLLERLSKHQLRRATTSDILNGNRVNLPDWRFVAIFVEACRSAAAESNLDTRDLGSLADWKRHWDSASIGVIDARFPGGGQPIPAGQDPSLGEGSPEQGHDLDSANDAHGPPVWGPVPPRLTDFVGREQWLSELHLRLSTGRQGSPVTIQGLCGIGKTQLAVEYAYRYAGAYDLVWWVPCDNAGSVQRAMAELRVRLGLPDADPEKGDDGYGELFDRLRQGMPAPRWLLIFDDVDEPDEIRHLVQPMGGHVLVTSRNSSWQATGDMLELEALPREESIEFLRRRMPRCTPAEAHRVAEAVGDLPLFLEHAVEARAAIGEYLARLKSDPLGLLDSQPSDYPASVAAQWRRSLDRLREPTPDPLDLLRCLCFFGNAPIPREALERARYLQNTSIQALLRDPIRPLRAITMLRRAGLLHVDADARTLTVHQVARYIVRDMVTREGADSAERSRHDAHLLLAAADPLNPEDPANWRSYQQLREHAAEADVEGCFDEAARRLIINLVRFLNAAGEPHGALSLADSALRRWAPESGQESIAAYDGRLVMRQARVDALFACGRYEEAFLFQQDTLDLMRSTPGDWGDEITLLGAVPGARGRMLGRFAEALAADVESRERHLARFGRDHPHSFAAATALILDLALTGQSQDAVRVARQVHEDCRAFHNDDSYPAVLFQRNVLARCLWLLGQYDAAEDMMSRAHAGYQALADRGILGHNHPWRLAHEVDLAVVRRDSSASVAEIAALMGDMQDVRRRCWRALGPDHPQTLAATVVLASILRRILGRAGEAVRLLADAERRYREALPDHPFSHACKGYLAVVRLQVAIGDRKETAASSAAELEVVIARLTDLAGDDHPLTLAARSALASVLADDGDPAAITDFTPLPL
jgi:tetratricopeptide (TPR) repeat protein